MNQPSRSLVRWTAASLALCTLGCVCPKVYLPASDATPPVITWKVTNQATNAVQTFTGDGTFQASLGQHFTVKMTASDTAGVHEASLSGSDQWNCIKGSVGSLSGPTLGTTAVEKHDVWPSGQVCSEIEMFRDVTLSFPCKPGYQFSSGSVRLTGIGKNFHGGKSQAVLTINTVP